MSDGHEGQPIKTGPDPIMSPHKEYNEINSYVVFWGLFFSVLFSLAVGYLCLKIGQTIDAFAPVSVLAMGMAIMFNRKNAFPETVHIQAIASASTNVIGGAMFILPALYILKVTDVTFMQMVIPVALGGILGVFLSTMFRRYFCEEMHYEYPFPAGRAAAEVLECSEGSSAKLMLGSGVIAMAYDFILNSLGWWQEVLSTASFSWGQNILDKYKLVMSLDSDITLLGIGYFTGIRYAAIITSGSFFAWFVCIPVVYYLGGNHQMIIDGQQVLLANAPVDVVFSQYVRHIGIGMLAMAGVIGLLSMSKVVVNVTQRAISDIFFSSKKAEVKLLRTQIDMPMSVVAIGILAMNVLFGLFFHFNFSNSLTQSLLAFGIVLVFSFMLSVVGISSIAFTGSEPVSGMTIFMIIVSAIAMGSVGMSGSSGIIAILMMATFLCSTLGVAGNFMSELKVAHLVGATPKTMQKWQIVALILSAFCAIGVILILDKAYGFTGPDALAAPQANAMAAIIQPLMEGGSAPWPLYMAGAFGAVILWMLKVPPLAFALGAYLPMEINLPLIAGGTISYIVSHSSPKEAINQLRLSKGTTVASGLVAGGAIGALISAVMHIVGVDMFMSEWVNTPGATYLGIAMYAIMCGLLYFVAMRGDKDLKEDAAK